MDKNAIKKYAVWARNELIARVSQKAQQYGITAAGYGDENADSVDGNLLSATEKKQRQVLIKKIKESSFEQVMEEVAYTWFNRFTALRFMEVNNYLPSHTRVFTNEANEFKPQILADAISLDLEGLDMDKVFALKDANKDEELYKYLLIVQCNALSSILPGMFQKIEDCSELLIPDHLLRVGSVIEQMISTIPEHDWTNQVQIIGWLYQYYNTEPKATVFSRPSSQKIKREEIPAATQLFTPEWIVRYMVENSLGNVWIKSSEKDDSKTINLKYYVEEAIQNEAVNKVINNEIHRERDPQSLTCIDPCMGSGHIIVALFDILIKMYEDYGYTSREAASLIVSKNIWGLDIDERASQLSYFAIMMKARQYDRRFFTKGVQPNVFEVVESNGIESSVVDYFVDGNQIIKKNINIILEVMKNAKEYGSIITIKGVEFDCLFRRLEQINVIENPSIFDYSVIEQLQPIIRVAFVLAQKYDVVATNPPYMAVSNCSVKLNEYIKKKYPDSKTDLFAVFIERCNELTNKGGYCAMITQHSWMFLGSFEKLRKKISSRNLVSMVHLGAHAFEEIGGEVVQTTAFVIRNISVKNYKGTYIRLTDEGSQDEKENAFIRKENIFLTEQERYSQIPGSPVSYWVSDEVIEAYASQPSLNEVSAPKQGLATTDNNRFVRLWHEVSIEDIGFGMSSKEADESGLKWFPLNKGGEFRKWYGNNDCIVNYQYDGKEIKDSVLKKYTYLKTPDFVVKNQGYYFKENGTWSAISSGDISVRYSPKGFVISNAGMAIFSEDYLKYIIAFMNSKCISKSLLSAISQTLNFNAGDIEKLPFIYDKEKANEIIELADKCIRIAKEDWDSRETSWDFKRHPLLKYGKGLILTAYKQWEEECANRFLELKQAEEDINRLFIGIYHLEKELSAEVEDSVIEASSHHANIKDSIISLISYSVGCMFGRYLLEHPGLNYAGGDCNMIESELFVIDEDNIIPINDDEYFTDDIVAKFVKFIDITFGHEYLEDNLQFIAGIIGGKGSPRDVIRGYFINSFYADHLRYYQKKPIYWLFDSGKKNGFKCLIYIHRYKNDTIARIRTDYVHEQQSRYRTAISDVEQRLAVASSSESVKLKKQLAIYNAQAEEVRLYEEQIHHLADQMISLNLDDGVKDNYARIQPVLAKLK
ncbi:MAG: BREX-1 system adenine-specific DNA-methyltransferase PglX [Blautia sp.]|nr:BREX-1 system adenine-specific DNA-methyltransferase PglX [Blautia sp.]